MDFGKLAYLKAEDLERALGRVKASSGTLGMGCASFEIGRSIFDEYYITDVVGSGNACLIIRVFAAAQSETSLSVLLDSKTCLRRTISEGEREYFLLIKTKLSGSAALSIVASGVFVGELELMIIGGETGYGGTELTGDSCSAGAIVLACKNEIVTAHSGIEPLSLEDGGRLAVARAADAATDGQSFFVLLLDLHGNLFAKSLASSAYKLLGSGYQSAAVSTRPIDQAEGDAQSDQTFEDTGLVVFEPRCGGFFVACVREGRVEAFDLDSLLDVAVASPVDSGTNARSVRLAKGSASPVLAVKTTNAGSYFVCAEQGYKGRAVASVAIRASVS